MNRIMDEFRADKSRVLDRLVDNELSDEERRAVLALLDESPDAWRSCSLAFIEAQLLRGDLRSLSDPPRLHGDSSHVSRDMASRRSAGLARGPSAFPLAIAVGLMLAFVIGYQAASWWSGSPKEELFAGHGREGAVAGRNGSPQGRSIENRPSDPVFVDRSSNFGPAPDDGGRSTGPSDPAWRTVELAVQDGVSGKRNMRLPVVDLNRVGGEQWLRARQQQSALSPVLRAALQESGMRIQEHQQLLPVELEDGSRLLFPVNQVEVGYEGGRAY